MNPKTTAALAAQDAPPLPFGGLSTTQMPSATPAAALAASIAGPRESTQDPVQALLQARAVVPGAGAVAALGPSIRGRMTLPHTAVPAKITTLAAPPPSGVAPRPSGAHLSPELARLVPELSLAAEAKAAPPKAAVGPTPPDREMTDREMTDREMTDRETADRETAAGPLPTEAVPAAMMQALEKYEAMLKTGRRTDATL